MVPAIRRPEDLAICHGLLNMTLIAPCNATGIAQMIPVIAAHDGPVYACLSRGKVPSILTRYKPDC